MILQQFLTVLGNLPRIPERTDWVFFCVLGCAFAFIFMLLSLNREATLRDFVVQDAADASNSFLNWIITSVVFWVLLSVMVSQYVPIIPQKISALHVAGFQLNKIGYTLLVVGIFYFVKSFFSFFFYLSTGGSKRWPRLYFAATRFYFVLSLVLMVLIVVHYFFEIDKAETLRYYIPACALVFLAKVAYYLTNRHRVLPKEWYYKILYICTLQIAPLLALWEALFL